MSKITAPLRQLFALAYAIPHRRNHQRIAALYFAKAKALLHDHPPRTTHAR